MRQKGHLPVFESWTEYLMAWLDRRPTDMVLDAALTSLKIQDDPEAIFQEGWLLCDVGEEVRVIERHAGANVDFVGSVLDTSILERANLTSARALILALDSDDSTLFATVIASDLAPDVPIINATRSRVTQPAPILLAAPSPMAGNQRAPASRGQRRAYSSVSPAKVLPASAIVGSCSALSPSHASSSPSHSQRR